MRRLTRPQSAHLSLRLCRHSSQNVANRQVHYRARRRFLVPSRPPAQEGITALASQGGLVHTAQHAILPYITAPPPPFVPGRYFFKRHPSVPSREARAALRSFGTTSLGTRCNTRSEVRPQSLYRLLLPSEVSPLPFQPLLHLCLPDRNLLFDRYSFSGNPCARSRMSAPSGVTR